MAKYEIFFRQSVLKKELPVLPKQEIRKIIEAIRALADNPRPHGVKKLSGQEQYRILQGDYRIVYSIQDDKHTLWVIKIGHRREVYR